MRNTIMLSLLLFSFNLVGCGGTGWVLKPIPLEEALLETTLAEDEGWFVSDKIVVIDVDGLIVNERMRGPFDFGENPLSLFVEKLDRVEADPDVRAVVLRINSPGGTVTTTDVMYRRVMDLRERRRIPVVAVIEDVGASGGYYLACAADEIVAQPTSITGSIGVIVQTLSLAGTMEKLGITAQAVTSGPFKDMASALKPLDDKDLAILQTMVDEYHRRFVVSVADGRRNLSTEQITQLADGRVYTGLQAHEAGLVDELGTVEDAIALAQQLSGAQRVKVVMYHRPFGYRANVYSRSPGVQQAQMNLLNISVPHVLDLTRPRFLYLWSGRSATSN